MKKLVKKMLPRQVAEVLISKKNKADSLLDWFYDYKRYRTQFAFSKSIDEKARKETYLLREYHAIEKGLSLSNPRLGFGARRLENIFNAIDDFIPIYGVNDVVKSVLSTLFFYYDFHISREFAENNILNKIKGYRELYEGAVSGHDNIVYGGTKTMRRSEILNASQVDFSGFALSRYSVRNFSDLEVSPDMISKAVEIAQKTPSVSNRQGWRVHVYAQNNLKELVLQQQPGNRGFCEYIPSLLLVTGVTSTFFEKERNQVYIDGGLFSMSLMYSLHSLGLGCCPLASNFGRQYDQNLRSVACIAEDEVPIMMMALGYLPDEVVVPVARRKPAEEVIIVHN